MTETKSLDLAVVIVAQSHNPSLLNPDFLKFNGIVPEDWELAVPPICAGPIAQVAFKSGITITAQPDRVIVTEVLAGRDKPLAPEIVKKYVQVLPHVPYSQIGLNPKIYAGIQDSEPDAPLLSRFLKDAAGLKREDLGALQTVGLRLGFAVPDGSSFNLSLDEGQITDDSVSLKHGILFGGNFHCDLRGETNKERIENLLTVLDQCENRIKQLETFIQSFLDADGHDRS